MSPERDEDQYGGKLKGGEIPQDCGHHKPDQNYTAAPLTALLQNFWPALWLESRQIANAVLPMTYSAGGGYSSRLCLRRLPWAAEP